MALRYTLGQIARIVKGTLSGDASLWVEQVVTDSREKTDGGLFIALRGDRFDGHDFAVRAVSNGASSVLVHKQIDGLMAPYILVPDTQKALGDLAVAKRNAFLGKIAAVTGSSGKTTTRRLLHSILSQRGKTLQPMKNFNNHIGVPLTLFELDEAYDAAVLELGCSDFGEIAHLAMLTDPDVGLVTNVGPAHLEKLGSLDGVARAKGELYLNMRSDTTAVINGDDPHTAAMPVKSKKRIVFGSLQECDVRLKQRAFLGADGQRLVLDLNGTEIETDMKLLGAHNAQNALAAAAAAVALDIGAEEIQAGISAVTPEAGRLVPRTSPDGLHLIDDTYNANPSSMRAALETLRESAGSGRSAAVLGDMLELGPESDRAHIKVGNTVAALGIDVLVVVGTGGRGIALGAIQAGMDPSACAVADNNEEAAQIVAEAMHPGEWVLIKGSRGMKLETAAEALVKGNA